MRNQIFYNLFICETLNSTGQLVVIGGVNSANNTNALAPMSSVWVYDPANPSTWTIQNVNVAGSRAPSPASDLTAVVSKY